MSCPAYGRGPGTLVRIPAPLQKACGLCADIRVGYVAMTLFSQVTLTLSPRLYKIQEHAAYKQNDGEGAGVRPHPHPGEDRREGENRCGVDERQEERGGESAGQSAAPKFVPRRPLRGTGQEGPQPQVTQEYAAHQAQPHLLIHEKRRDHRESEAGHDAPQEKAKVHCLPPHANVR